jgi:hypothetical protein
MISSSLANSELPGVYTMAVYLSVLWPDVHETELPGVYTMTVYLRVLWPDVHETVLDVHGPEVIIRLPERPDRTKVSTMALVCQHLKLTPEQARDGYTKAQLREHARRVLA